MSDGHRWSGYSHEELYKKINSGPGPRASFTSLERWEGIAGALVEINAQLQEGVARSGAQWQGLAADQARAGINPLAEWADHARTGAVIMRASNQMQADYIAKARADMPEPVKVTAEDPGTILSGLAHLVGVQTDFEVQERAQNIAEQRARDVMTTYASSTTANTATLGQFSQPPQVAITAGEVVRGDAAGVAYGHGFGGGRGGVRGGGRGGPATTRPTTRPVAETRPGTTKGGSSTHVSQANPSNGGTNPRGSETGAKPTTGSGIGVGGTTGSKGRDKEAGRSDSARHDTTTEQRAAAEVNGLHVVAPGQTSGTTAISSGELGAFTAANAQHSAAMGPGGAAGALGAANQANGDSTHRRAVPLAPQGQAFDPFGGLGGRRAEEEEEQLHDAADYLRETGDVYGVGRGSAPVIGEDQSDR
ncbi:MULTISPECIES: PPE domain-containing protein [Actinosynnema]|uniref:PPE domain-containing protein n=1 Tax=Actinosynnema TaxID=40566 RepID=UPI0020A54497|nr:PPE domain-containing protein [Actinosynnema pretiosum]MCP2095456.1 PPE family protein [Actinosynnema pretiosum]